EAEDRIGAIRLVETSSDARCGDRPAIAGLVARDAGAIVRSEALKERIGRIERRSTGHGLRYTAVVDESKRRQRVVLACNRAQSDRADEQNCHRTEELRASGHDDVSSSQKIGGFDMDIANAR